MADEKARGEEEILAAELALTVDGRARTVRVRRIRAARTWKRSLLSAMAGGVGKMSLDNITDGGDVAATIGDRMLELVVAYDVDAALGGREYLEDHATDAEIYQAFRAMLSASFPFASDLRTAVVELRALGLSDLLAAREAVGSAPESFTPGPSESGDSLLVASTKS